MKSTELRIGNIIESRTKHPVKANWGTLRALSNGEKTYYPIPLTEEWLLKFGFKKENPYIIIGLFTWMSIIALILNLILLVSIIIKYI